MESLAPTAPKPIFVSDDGRRARILRIGGRIVGGLVVLWLVALLAGTLGVGRLPGVPLPQAGESATSKPTGGGQADGSDAARRRPSAARGPRSAPKGAARPRARSDAPGSPASRRSPTATPRPPETSYLGGPTPPPTTTSGPTAPTASAPATTAPAPVPASGQSGIAPGAARRPANDTATGTPAAPTTPGTTRMDSPSTGPRASPRSEP